MNALTGFPISNSGSSDPIKAVSGFAGQQHQIFQLALGISLVVVAINYLRERQVNNKNVPESLVVWALALSHIVYRTIGDKLLHFIVTSLTVVSSVVFWSNTLIDNPSEALFLQLLLLSVLQAVL